MIERLPEGFPVPDRAAQYRPTPKRPTPSAEARGSREERGYDHRWRKATKAYLNAHPLCVRCSAQNRVAGSEVVDHIIPHKGDRGLFWDISNWQALCKRCHDRKSATE